MNSVPPPSQTYAPPAGPPPSTQTYQPPAGPPPSNDSKQQYQAPAGPPPGASSASPFSSPPGPPPKAETSLMSLGRDEYRALLPTAYLTINRIQAPELFKDYLRSIGKKRKSLFGGSKDKKELAKDYDSKLVYQTSSSTKRFYSTDDDLLNVLVDDQCLPRINRLAQRFGKTGKEYLFYDLAQICLFDIFFYIDNSGSMATSDRLKQLYDFLKLFMDVNVSSQPLRIRIMNNHVRIAQQLWNQFGVDLNNITTQEQLTTVFNNLDVSGVTPLATSLLELILKPEVLDKDYLVKPILIVMFTDGAPTRDKYTLVSVIGKAQDRLRKMKLPKRSICYQIAQIGDDRQAGEYLDDLDDNPLLGDVIDCTSPIEKEMRQMSRKNPELSTEVNYVKKLLLGAIDMTYDSMDEVQHKVF